MSQTNVERIRALMPPDGSDMRDVFVESSDFSTDGLVADDATVRFVAPDAEASGTGPEGFRNTWADWLEPWESYRVEVEDVVDAGDDALVLVRDYGRRARTTGEVSVVGGAVWTVREGRVARVAFYLKRSEALEAVGLSE